VNQEIQLIEKVTVKDIHDIASEILKESNSNTLYYKAIKNQDA
jgi:hypothetical protein